MSLAWSLAGLVLAAMAPHGGGNVMRVGHPPPAPKPVVTASAKDCEMFAAVAYQKWGWAKTRSKWPLLADVEEPKAIYRVDCPWATWGLKAPAVAGPRAPIVIILLRPQYFQGGNVASVTAESQQDRNSKSGPETASETYHVGKRNYGGGQVYWVVY
jgi:hypothetical protein